MASLNQIVDEVTAKYGLGSQGVPLVRELLALITQLRTAPEDMLLHQRVIGREVI